MSKNIVTPLERNIAIGAVIVGFVTFPFMLGKCQPSDIAFSSSHPSPAVVATPDAEDSKEIARLHAELEQAYGHIDVAQDEMTEARNNYYAIQQEMKQLQKLNKTRKASPPISQPVIEDVPPVVTPEPITTKTVIPITPDPQIAILTAQLTALKPDTSQTNSELQQKLEQSAKHLTKVNAENEEHQKKIAHLNQLISQDDKAQQSQKVDKLMNSLRNENTELRRTQTKLKEQAAAAKKQWQTKLKKSGAPYQAEITDLKGKLALLRSQSVFATSSEELDEKSGELFKKLQSLEQQNPTDLAKSYQDIANQLKSDDLTRVKFGTGSISLDQRSKNKIDAVLKDIKPGDSFLIVGYASNQGGKQLNERLSSNRAKAVAERVLGEIGSDNKAKAVYLGETTRFGEVRENQCVELWKIRK